MYQPLPGQKSTTVILGCKPKKRRVSIGWRQTSRALSVAERHGPATAHSREPSGGPAGTAGVSGAALSSFLPQAARPAKAAIQAPARTARRVERSAMRASLHKDHHGRGLKAVLHQGQNRKPHQFAVWGLRKRRVMRSLSPMASKAARSSAVRVRPARSDVRVGGRVQTPNG
ncbi:hypothetical protein D3C86_1255490 [compost metagenome]